MRSCVLRGTRLVPGKGRLNDMRVKLMYPPRLYSHILPGIRRVHAGVPPISLPMLVSYLRSHGIKANQDDLDIRLYHSFRQKRSRNAIDLTPFLDERRILNALGGGDEEQLFKAAERCLSLTKTRGYDVVGFSITEETDLTEIGTALIMAKLLKEKYDPTLIIGGSAANHHLYWHLIDEAPFIAFSSRHSTHAEVLNFLNMIRNGELDVKKYNLQDHRVNLPALSSRTFPLRDHIIPRKRARAEPVFHTPKEPSVDYFLPMPVFDGLPLDLYRFIPEDASAGEKMLVLPYKYLSGCPGRCAFCTESGRPFFIHKSPETIADELEYLSRRLRTNCFLFLNSTLNPTRRFTEALADELIRRDLDLQWADCASFMMLDGALLRKLADAGAKKIIFGLESASGRILEYVGKSVTPAKAERLLRISDGLGIWNELEIIAGFPHELKEDILATEQFLRKNRDVIDYFYVNRFHIPINSRMFLSPKEFGIKNIREDRSAIGFAYDEINGLNWDIKNREVKKSFEYLKDLQEELYSWDYMGSGESTLKWFYLQRLYRNKVDVREHLRRHSTLCH